MKTKTPPVGGVSLANREFPPSLLDTPYEANPWRYPLGHPIRKPHKLNTRRWTSDDPFDTPLNLADRWHGGGSGQPAWLKAHNTFGSFARILKLDTAKLKNQWMTGS